MKQFLSGIVLVDGRVQAVTFEPLNVDDLPQPVNLTAGTVFGAVITTNPQGQITAISGITTAMTVYGWTYDPVTATATPITTPPTGTLTRLVTVTATVGNVDDDETDLSTTSIPGATLGTNGDVIEGIFSGSYVDDAAPSFSLRLYFGTTVFFDSGSKGVSGAVYHWTIRFTIIRVSDTVVRCNTTYTDGITAVATNESQYTVITGLADLDSNAHDLDLTGESVGGATNDITLTMGYVEKHPVA